MKKKVLIIDDDLDICREIKYALQSETTDAFYALSATDGLPISSLIIPRRCSSVVATLNSIS